MAGEAEIFAVTLDELSKKKKDELFRMVLVARELHATAPSTTNNDPQTLAMQETMQALTECTWALKTEVKELRDQVKTLQDQLKDATDNRLTSPPPSTSGTPPLMSDVIRNAMQSTLNEKFKSELIISNVSEDENNENFLQNLCSTIETKVQPQGAIRVGQKSELSVPAL
jgi:uncharacterized coiled-coil protein SlyX